MGVALEAWVLWWLAAVQFLVAVWWWRGPRLAHTRWWVTGAFAFNGLSTLAAGFQALGLEGSLALLGQAADRWSDALLFGFALVAIRAARDGPHRLPLLALPVVLVAFWVGLAYLPFFHEGPVETWFGFEALVELPLSMAVIATLVALPLWMRQLDRAEAQAWLLALAVVGMHYTEIVVKYFVPSVASDPLPTDPLLVVDRLTNGAAILAAVVASAALVVIRVRRGGARVPSAVDPALALVLGGYFLGLARLGQGEVATLVFLAIGLVRPAGFAGARALCHTDPPRRLADTRAVAGLALTASASLVGVVLGEALWVLDPPNALALGAAFLLVAAPLSAVLARRVGSEADREHDPGARATPAVPALEHDRVPLPDDWREQLEAAGKRHAALPRASREALAKMPRWQRLLLAVDALPDELPGHAYERTTPGLHLATHCPYASVGPELARMNQRWQAIVEERGLERPRGPVDGKAALVRSTWGRAEGLKSGRAKMYEITPLGRDVAARLWDELGLQGTPAERALLGEAFGRSMRPPAAPHNPR